MHFFELHQAEFEVVFYIAMAMLLGAILGLEREFQNKPAGLRTHMLVAGSAALLVSLGDVLVQTTATQLTTAATETDPTRLIQAVVTGVSFLGAGTIIRNRSGGSVEGLTTAASILLTAAIGICVAIELWVLAVSVTLLTLLALRGLGYLEHHINTENQ